MKGWNTGYSKEEAAPVQVLRFEEEKTFQNVPPPHKFSAWYCYLPSYSYPAPYFVEWACSMKQLACTLDN